MIFQVLQSFFLSPLIESSAFRSIHRHLSPSILNKKLHNFNIPSSHFIGNHKNKINLPSATDALQTTAVGGHDMVLNRPGEYDDMLAVSACVQ